MMESIAALLDVRERELNDPVIGLTEIQKTHAIVL
jgi:hypothetical protein